MYNKIQNKKHHVSLACTDMHIIKIFLHLIYTVNHKKVAEHL